MSNPPQKVPFPDTICTKVHLVHGRMDRLFAGTFEYSRVKNKIFEEESCAKLLL